MAQRVPVPQLGHDRHWVQTSVLGQREWNHLQCVSKGLDAVLLGTFQGPGVLGQLLGQFDLDGTATWNDASVLDKAPDDAQRVME